MTFVLHLTVFWMDGVTSALHVTVFVRLIYGNFRGVLCCFLSLAYCSRPMTEKHQELSANFSLLVDVLSYGLVNLFRGSVFNGVDSAPGHDGYGKGTGGCTSTLYILLFIFV